MKKLCLALATVLAISMSSSVFAADYIPAPAPPPPAPPPAPELTCHQQYGLFALFHCWHHGYLWGGA